SEGSKQVDLGSQRVSQYIHETETNADRARHLSNNGVEETPPSSHFSNGAVDGCAKVSHPDPNELFIELDDRNVPFRHWHPTPVTGNGGRLCGQSDVGGLWEWTSTPLAPHDGFKAMDLYPG